MSDHAIIQNLGATIEDGRDATKEREVKLSYVKGRGIVLGIWTRSNGNGFTSYDLFGDNNTQTLVIPLKRARPALLDAAFNQIKANAARIFETLGPDWHDLPKGDRQAEAIQKIAALVQIAA